MAERRERARLAEALHDGPLQRLAALRLAGTDPGVAHQLDAAIEETRAIVTSLHPTTISQLGFEACVRAAAAPFQTARRFHLTVNGPTDDPRLAHPVLVPVARGPVVNAAKHARPTTITVTVAVTDDRIELEVHDDGVGIAEPRNPSRAAASAWPSSDGEWRGAPAARSTPALEPEAGRNRV